MSAGGHTPGPWHVEIAGLGCKSIKGHKTGPYRQSQYEELAFTAGLADEAEDAANAKLMAAAPALADALQSLLDNSSAGTAANLPTWVCAADDAIKALRAAGRLP